MISNEPRTVPLGRNAKYGTLTVDVVKFNDAVWEHLFTYGLRQALNDAIADRDGLTNDEIVAKATKRLDTFYAGELRTRSASGEPVDPVENRAWKIAKLAISKMAQATPQWKEPKVVGDHKGDAKLEAVLAARLRIKRIKVEDDMSATEYTINAYLAQHPDVREQARIAVEAENAGKANEFEI